MLHIGKLYEFGASQVAGYSAQAIQEFIDFLLYYRFFVNYSFDLLYVGKTDAARGAGDALEVPKVFK